MAFSGTQQKCKACDKTVYLVDQLTADGVVYHKACFRCNHCKGTLKLGNYASLEGVLYCRPHFEQLFKMTGSYDKSFENKGAEGGLRKQASDKQEVCSMSQSTCLGDSSEEHDVLNSSLTRAGPLVVSGYGRMFDRILNSPELVTLRRCIRFQNKAPSKASLLFSGTQEKCVACNKTVYPIEKTSVEGLPYHKSCFKCVHGGCNISPSNYAALEGRLYCKHHYSQLFKEKGNYSQLTKTPALKPTASNASTES